MNKIIRGIALNAKPNKLLIDNNLPLSDLNGFVSMYKIRYFLFYTKETR